MIAKPLPSCADIGGLYCSASLMACAFVFWNDKGAPRFLGDLGIRRAAPGELSYAPSFRCVAEHAYEWTALSGVDLEGRRLFEAIHEKSPSIPSRINDAEIRNVASWLGEVRTEYPSWFILTAIVCPSVDDASSETKEIFSAQLENNLAERKLSTHELDVWINPEVVALAVRHHLNPVACLLNAREVIKQLRLGDGTFVIPSEETLARAKAYRSQLKRLSGAGFRFSPNLSFSRFDTLSPAVVPGSLFLPTSFPREETIGVGSDSRPLLPRHLLMSKDGTIEIDKLLDFGRYSCGCFPFSPNHEAKLETGSPANRSDSGAAWLTKEEVVVFAPGWLLTHLLGQYLSGDMSGLLSTARESLLRAITPQNPRRAEGRLFHADFEAINNLAFPSQDSADQMFKRFNEIRVNDGLLRNVAAFDLSNPSLVSMGAELSDEFLPAGFCWFMRSVDASFLLQVAGDTEIAVRGEDDLRFLNQLIYQGLLAQIEPFRMSPSKGRLRTFADHLLMIVYAKGAGDFRSDGGDLLVEALGDTCLVLMRKFADNMTRLAFRYALEGAGILATLGNPPYPVAAWSRKWLFSQWKRYAFSQGTREVKKILKQFHSVKRVKRLSKAERLRQTGDGHTVGEAVDDIVEPLSKAESG